MAMKQEANTPVVMTIGAISCLLILVIYFGVEAWFRYEERNEMTALWRESPNTWLLNLRGPQLERLQAESVDAKTGARHVPIGVAMEAFIATGGKPATTQPSTDAPPAAKAE